VQFTECSIDLLEEKAYLLALRVTQPTCILLWGTVGSGKTVFARAFIRSYYSKESLRVISPTFTLVQVYSGKTECPGSNKLDIWHLDLYRIKKKEEIIELGLEEGLEKNICVIEWPDRCTEIPAQNIINVYLSVVSENLRDVAIHLP
jgi:tRNA threonylcarbamoyladenosine biosynthesis protein TsaE